MFESKKRRSYEDVAKTRLLRVIHTEAQYKAVQKEITRLFQQQPLSNLEEDYLDTLALLVERYEEEHHPIDTTHISPLESLENLLNREIPSHRIKKFQAMRRVLREHPRRSHRPLFR